MEEKEQTMIQIENVSKVYKLGEIGGTTLREAFQRLFAKIFHKEDPTKKIGAKNYNKGEKFLALDNINLNIKKGERIGIIGHNGAGKSTLLKLICRVTAPTTGEIGLNGRITSMLEVGTGFHPELTGRENIYVNGAILGMTKKEIDEVIEEIIDFSEVREFIDTPVKRYSSGMYVKLAFSVAAHLKSEIMIMDEVLAVGDIQFQKKCLKKMKKLSESGGRTVLYVSHNMSTIRELCDRVIVLSHGRVVFNGEVEEGIRCYSSASDNMELCPYYDFSSTKRALDFPRQVKIDSLTFINKEIAVFTKGERVSVSVTYTPIVDFDEVGFRFQLYLDGVTLLGSCFLDSYFPITKNKKGELLFTFDTKNLVPAKYSADVILFCFNGVNGGIAADIISKGISFEVIDDSSDKYFKWWRDPLGYVDFEKLVFNLSKQDKQ